MGNPEYEFGQSNMNWNVDVPTLLFTFPAKLWRLYIDHLWNVQSGSWVARTASTFQFLAYLIITPFVLLTLLDVMSYMIARTLGVVETTKASTSDSARVPVTVYAYPEAPETDSGLPGSAKLGVQSLKETAASASNASDSFEGAVHRLQSQPSGAHEASIDPIQEAGLASRKPRFELTLPSTIITSVEPEACFFSPSDEKSLELSGALLSSPAMSRQVSPVQERRRLAPFRVVDIEADSTSTSSDNDSESFTILERNSEADSVASGEGLGLTVAPGSGPRLGPEPENTYLGTSLRRRGGALSQDTDIHQ